MLLATSIIVFALFLVANHYRAGLLAALLSHLTDEVIEIESIRSISIGHKLSIDATGISSAQSEFDFQAGQLTIGIGVFQDRFYLEDIVVRNARINVHPTQKDKPARASFAVAALPRNYAFENVTVTYLDDDQHWLAHISQCSGNKKDKSTLIRLACRGELNDDDFSISGDYGMKDNAGLTEPLDMVLRWGQFSLMASGYLDSPISLVGADINLEIEASDNQKVLALLGIHEVKESPLSGKLHLFDANQHYHLDAHIEMGDLQLTLAGSIGNEKDDLLERPQFDLDFEVAGHSLYELGALFNEFRLQPEPFSGKGHIRIAYPEINFSSLTLNSGSTGELRGNLYVPAYPSLKDMHANIHGKDIRPALITRLAERCEPLNKPIDFKASIINDTPESQEITAELINEHLSVKFAGRMYPESDNAGFDVAIEHADIAPLGVCASLDLPALSAGGRFRLDISNQVATLTNLQLNTPVGNATGKVTLSLANVGNYEIDLLLDIPNTPSFFASLDMNISNLVPIKLSTRLKGRGNPQGFIIDDFRTSHLTNRVSLAGELKLLSDATHYRFTVNAQGEDLREILADKEATSTHPQPYVVSANIEGNRNQITVHQFTLDVVQSHLDLQGTVAITDGFNGTRAKLRTRGRNLENLLGHLTNRPIPSVPFEVTAEVLIDSEIIRVSELTGDIGAHSLIADLLIDRPPNHARTKGEVILNGPSTHELLNLLSVDLEILDRPYSATLSLEGTKEKIILSSLSAEIGESDVTGSATIGFDEKPLIQARLKSNALFLPLLSPKLADDNKPVSPESAIGPGSRVFSSTRISLPLLNKVNADLNWQLDKTWISDSYQTKIDLDLSLNNGVVSTKKFHWQNDFSSGGIDLTIDGTSENLKIAASSRSTRFPVLWLLAGEASKATNTAFRGQIRTQGKTMADLMANLDGTVLFKDGQGRIQAGKLEGFFGDFLHNLSSKIIERKKDNLTNVICTAGAIKIKQGLMSFKPGFVIRTDRVDLFATGELNLATEKPNINVITRPITGIGVSPIKVLAPKMKVTGTLTKPAFAVDATSSALSAGAAFFTGGMSVLASTIWDKINSKNEACDLLYEQALKLPEFAGHDGITVTPQNSGNTIQN